mmetsp:Transcript_40474/g.116335  ORF Transcript_40474/g.116335 Transcript_40474/m.116335 type:complete len:298 (-) Transcript_40474:18-911(-)
MTRYQMMSELTAAPPDSLASTLLILSVALARKMGEMILATFDRATKTHVITALNLFTATSAGVPVEGQKYGFSTVKVCRKLNAEEYCAVSAPPSPSAAAGASGSSLLWRAILARRKSVASTLLNKAVTAPSTRVGLYALHASSVPPSSANLAMPTMRPTRQTRLAAFTEASEKLLKPAASATVMPMTSRHMAAMAQSRIDDSKDQRFTWDSANWSASKEKGDNRSSGESTKSKRSIATNRAPHRFARRRPRSTASLASQPPARGTRPSSSAAEVCIAQGLAHAARRQGGARDQPATS